ncbi:MAG: 6-pyruvoyl trahydropterin synthase family protein [Candidatus Altarchaeaceae archaeon]
MEVKITKFFSAAHFLINHEKCGKIHGHNWKVIAYIDGKVNEKGWVIDFIVLKKIIDEILDKYDHKLLLPNSLNFQIDEKDNIVAFEANEKKYKIPKDDCVILNVNNITCENLSILLCSELKEKLKNYNIKGIEKIGIEIEEREGQGAKHEEKF